MTTQFAVPSSIVAGDTFNLQLTYSDFQSTSFTGSFNVRGPIVMSIPGIATGSGDYAFILTPGSASLFRSGTYDWTITVSNSLERYTVDSGRLYVIADITKLTPQVNLVEQMLAAVENAIQNRLTDGVVSLSTAGRSLSMIPLDELFARRTQLRRELAALTQTDPDNVQTFHVGFRRVS